MAVEFQFINDKPKMTFTKKRSGQVYTRKGFDLPVALADRFSKKCGYFRETESRMVERLIEAFVGATGWGPETKQAPADPKMFNHAREAASEVAQDFSWFGR
jgi:hypothetical protein